MTKGTGGHDSRCVLTTRDQALLEAMLQRRIASGDPILPLLQQKLADATVVGVDEVAADVVTLNSRVAFSVNAGAVETRTLARQENRGLVGSNLFVSTPRGLALLGLSEGQQVVVERADGGRESIRVEKVVYQPEAARRQETERSAMHRETAGRPALRLVHSATSDDQPLGATWKMRQSGRDDDDPGPSAA